MSHEQPEPREHDETTLLSAIQHVVPSRRVEVGLVCVTALFSFALTVVVTAEGGRDLGSAAFTGALISSYATPILCAWPGSWLLSLATRPRAVSLGLEEGLVVVDGERFAIDQLSGFRITPTRSGGFLFLTRPGDVTSLVLELDEADAARLPKWPRVGGIRFVLAERRNLGLVRVAIGACIAAAALAIGSWIMLMLLIGSALLVPILWMLMLVDLSRFHVVVGEAAITIDNSKTFPLRDTSTTWDGGALSLASRDGALLRHAPLRLWWPYRRSEIRILKAVVDAIRAQDGAPWDRASRRLDV